MSRIYLDNHQATKPTRASIKAMAPFLTELWGSPTAPHAMGEELLFAMNLAYDAIYALLGAKSSDSFIFTSSGAEAVNHVALATYLDRIRGTGRNHLLTSALDEAPIILAYERLAQLGCQTDMVKVNENGVVTLKALEEAITPRTALFSLSFANALTGVIHPVAELAELCRMRGIWFHLDATHILGKIPFDLDEIGPDLLSFSGEALHAPRGTGGLWIRSGLRLSPLILGGNEQDGQRGGPFSPALLAGLGVAATEAKEAQEGIATETARLRNLLESALLAIPAAQGFFRSQNRLPTTTVISFPGVVSDALLYALAREGVLASFGGGSYQNLSLQLEASGVPREVANCSIALTLSRFTTQEEIERAIDIITRTVTRLRRISHSLTPI